MTVAAEAHRGAAAWPRATANAAKTPTMAVAMRIVLDMVLPPLRVNARPSLAASARVRLILRSAAGEFLQKRCTAAAPASDRLTRLAGPVRLGS